MDVGKEWQEWKDVVANIDDVAAVSRLGFRYYGKFYGGPTPPDETEVELTIRAFATLLQRAFSQFDRSTLREVHRHLVWQGSFFEPGLVEDPLPVAEAHSLLESALAGDSRPVLLELLMIAHDLEFFVRPSLLRLLWVARKCDPSCRITYAASQLQKGGRQGSLRYGLDGLAKWTKSTKSGILQADERQALATLVASFKSRDSTHIAFDDLRNWVDHRDFLIGPKNVILNFHPARTARRLEVPREQITEMRRELLGLMCELKAFETMFRLHDVARTPMIKAKPGIQSPSR